MSFVLDTNICSAHFRRPGGLAHRFIQYVGRLFVPSVVVAELYAGAYHVPTPTTLPAKIADLLMDVAVLDFDVACAERFEEVRGEKKRFHWDATVPCSEAIRSRQEMEVEVQKIIAGGMITRAKFMTLPLLVPALGQGLTASMRAEARQNCAIAAQLYRLQHGTLPLSLADLTEFLPGDESQKPSWLADPFDGQPLRFKSEETRLLIYSIGQNLVDDGGQIESEKPTDRDLGYAVEERQGDSG